MIDQAEHDRQAERDLLPEAPLTDEQWRYIGQCNGRMF